MRASKRSAPVPGAFSFKGVDLDATVRELATTVNAPPELRWDDLALLTDLAAGQAYEEMGVEPNATCRAWLALTARLAVEAIAAMDRADREPAAKTA